MTSRYGRRRGKAVEERVDCFTIADSRASLLVDGSVPRASTSFEAMWRLGEKQATVLSCEAQYDGSGGPMLQRAVEHAGIPARWGDRGRSMPYVDVREWIVPPDVPVTVLAHLVATGEGPVLRDRRATAMLRPGPGKRSRT